NSGRPKTIAIHPERKTIDKQIVLGLLPMSHIAKRLGLHPDTVRRYAKEHISEESRREIILAARREERESEDDEINEDQVEITKSMQRVLREIEAILNRVKGDDDALALTALRDMRQTLMDLGKLYGQLNDKTTIQVSINEAPEWVRLRLILGDVFRAHPEAGQAFLARANQERLSIAGQPV
ncbi:MAG: hypothetical protein V2I43_25845, partial [Parvularcula sp.]|nr:hypothetical protein [Parvularcula sp.]